MPPDCYKIEVIHYLNPHQIWIEVRDPSVVKNDFLFEQIGVYGLLPLEKTLDILTEDLKVLKCEEWLPAAAAIIKDALEESDEVWFSPIYIDRRTSIFDDNIHKYGEIIFKTKNGKFKMLSKKLIKSGFAYKNVGEFHEKLSNGQLKTKLSTIKTQEVIKNLENYCLGHEDKPHNKWKKSVKEQTSVFHMSQNFELSLTESNLEKHNNDIIKETLKHKYKDFALCKDIDDQSLGRAYRKMKSTSESGKQEQKSQFLSKKLSISKKLSNSSKTENQTYSGIVKILAANSNVKDLNQTNESQSTSENNTSSEIDVVGPKENKENFISRKLKHLSKLEKAKKSVDCESECDDVNEVESNIAVNIVHSPETAKNIVKEHPVDNFKIEQKHMKKYLFKESIDETDSSGNQFNERKRSGNSFGEKMKSGNQCELKTRSGNQFVVETKYSNQHERKRKSVSHFEDKSESAQQMDKKKSSYDIVEKASSDEFKEEKVYIRKTARRSGKPTDNRSPRQIAFGPPGMDPKFFNIQVITPEDYEEEIYKKKEIDIERAEKSEKRDCMYGYVDSDVDVEITNKQTLEEYLKKGKSIDNENDNVKVGKNNVKSVKSSEVRDNRVNSKMRCEKGQEIVKSCAIINERDNLVEKSNKNSVRSERSFDDDNDTEIDEKDNKIECDIKYNKKKIHNENEFVKCGVGIQNSNNSINVKKSSSVIKRKLNTYLNAVKHNSSFSSSDTSNKDSSSDVATNNIACNKANDDDDIEKVIENLNLKYKDDNICKLEDKSASEVLLETKLKNNVNPFKNIDPNISVFVDKLVTPVLMVHSKHDKRIQPVFDMSDVYFDRHIKNILKNMSVEGPMMLQSITWNVILRGYSLFIISPMASGKTLGYLPAVCRLVSDSKLLTMESGGPMCIIVCATAQSVTSVEKMARNFLEKDKKVLACYAGVDNFHITTTLLNGCDLLIATPSALVRLLQATDFGLDLRRLSTFVLDDCERLSNVYADEIKFFTHKIKEMLKTRANKYLKVQYVLASRIWCDFMEPLAKKVPDTVICIGAFQECVLYSKTNTSVTLVKKENKIDSVFEFLSDINASKRTVIVCQSNEEVSLLEKALKRSNHIVFSCNNDMTVHDLFNISVSWADYSEPLIGPILICCDDNLIHMNITDAHNLLHYSMPPLFSMFCKRFSVLNDNYPSIFKANNENVKIKVLLEESNVEQLPKILNFIKRCTENVPSVLDEIASNVLKEKDVIKAKKYYPLCDNLLTLGYCPDFYNCQERHTILKDYDAPKDWLPKQGTITCKVLYYHSATLFSARILSCTINGTTTNYPQTYNKLSLKMGMYYSKESNRKLHGTPEIGDICATSIKLNFYARCQVLKILSRYERGNPNKVLVKLIDEERLEVTRDIYLYYMPDELKDIESRVVHVRLANIEPKDKDITFSELARDRLKNITETDTELFIRGKVSLTLGNCIFVNTLEACQDLTSLNEVVVKYNLKQELLENHAIPNPEHLSKLEKLCSENGLIVREVKNEVEPKTPIRNLPKGTWAHLERDSLSSVLFASAINPDKFFVRLDKFESCMVGLLQDIKKYVDTKPTPCATVQKGEIVLAKFPADDMYERARIDCIKEETAKCFFVDQGDWKEIPLNDLIPITEQFINKLPFQAIECRLVGIQPMGNQWTDFSTNWFIDNCYSDNGDLKCLFVKYFTKDPAEFTNGHKYSVVVIDTSTEQDIILNQLMIDLNLAKENHSEIKYLDDLDYIKPEQEHSDTEEDVWEETVPSPTNSVKEMRIDNTNKKIIVPAESNILFKAPLRTVPLVNSDNESDTSDKWDVNINDDCMDLFPALKNLKNLENSIPKVQTGNILKSAELDNKGAELVELDSDDLTSPDNTIVSPEKPISTNKDMNKEKNPALDMKAKEDGNKKPVNYNKNSKAESNEKKRTLLDLRAEIDPKRRPKLIWRQNKTNVTIKIQLIGADNYNLDIGDRILVFSADVNDIEYGFELELCGVVHKEKCSHVNKGQYILVNLKKVLNKNWLTLTKDGGIKKWIVYDVDSLDTSSDEETTIDNIKDIVRNIHNKVDTESEDDDFDDDINRGYKKYD